jgi:hypothetical protein
VHRCQTSPFSADRVDVLLDIAGNALAVATDAAVEVDKVVGVADGTDTLADLLTLPGEALGLLTSGFHVLRDLLPSTLMLALRFLEAM